MMSYPILKERAYGIDGDIFCYHIDGEEMVWTMRYLQNIENDENRNIISHLQSVHSFTLLVMLGRRTRIPG